MDKVTVTQADREAAADHLAKQPLSNTLLRLRIREGKEDNHPLVQAFARHRIEATRQAEEQIKLLREALEEIVEPVKFMKQRADAEGNQLSGMAWSIARETSYLQSIARQALEATNG